MQARWAGAILLASLLPTAAVSDPAHCNNDQNSAFSKFDYLTYALQFKVACSLDFAEEAAWFTEHAIAKGCSQETESYQMLETMVDQVVVEIPDAWVELDLPPKAKEQICTLATRYSQQTNSESRDEATKARDWETWGRISEILSKYQHNQSNR